MSSDPARGKRIEPRSVARKRGTSRRNSGEGRGDEPRNVPGAARRTATRGAEERNVEAKLRGGEGQGSGTSASGSGSNRCPHRGRQERRDEARGRGGEGRRATTRASGSESSGDPCRGGVHSRADTRGGGRRSRRCTPMFHVKHRTRTANRITTNLRWTAMYIPNARPIFPAWSYGAASGCNVVRTELRCGSSWEPAKGWRGREARGSQRLITGWDRERGRPGRTSDSRSVSKNGGPGVKSDVSRETSLPTDGRRGSEASAAPPHVATPACGHE